MFARIPPEIFWPGMVVAILGLSIAANVVLVVKATGDNGAQIIDNYYSKGAHWDDEVARVKKSADLGWKVTARLVESGESTGALTLTFYKDAEALTDLDVDIVLKDPTRNAPVTLAKAEHQGQGVYTAATDLPRLGLWDIEVVATSGETKFEDKIRVEVRR